MISGQFKWIYKKLLSKNAGEAFWAYAHNSISDVVLGNNIISKYRKEKKNGN